MGGVVQPDNVTNRINEIGFDKAMISIPIAIGSSQNLAKPLTVSERNDVRF